jgi:hypothetical protein
MSSQFTRNNIVVYFICIYRKIDIDSIDEEKAKARQKRGEIIMKESREVSSPSALSIPSQNIYSQ